MVATINSTSPPKDSLARLLNLILGVWLFVSAFLWPHSSAQQTNTWILGVLAVIFALAAMRVPRLRFLNTTLALWLFFSAWVLPGGVTATIANNVFVAISIFILSLLPPVDAMTGRGQGGANQRTSHA